MKKNHHPKWPEPPENLAERLLHTLDIFNGEPSDMRVITATEGEYAKHGEQHSWTGLTLGDLRAVADIMIGETYTLADHKLMCQFGYTGAHGPRACCRCGISLRDYTGGDCPKALRR